MQSSRKLTAGIDPRLLILLAIAISALCIWSATARMQTRNAQAPPAIQPQAPTVRASGRGFPHVVLQDGKELIGNGNAENSNAQPTALAAADFDSDGISDLVTVDQNGTVNLYKGNARLFNADGPEAQQRRVAGLPDPDAFSPTDKAFNLSVAPDFFVTGDFNADGHQDILATAKGDAALHLLAGNGRGNFAKEAAITVEGTITAFATGEIGRPDGQTDLALAVTNKKNAQLLVFEHPESAFKHKPETFQLSAAATELAIGNLDEDFYADIAVGSGNQLTIVHGRGQAYPWDIVASSGIKRPAAVVATRKLSFTISALAIGRFGNQRGQSLAVLGGNGNIYRFQPNRVQAPAYYELSAKAKGSISKNLFLPTNTEAKNLGIFSAQKLSREEAERLRLPLVNRSRGTGNELEANLQERQAEAATKYKSLGAKGIEALTLAAKALGQEQRAKARDAFLRTISARPSILANWQQETLVDGSQFASASVSSNSTRMLRVNVSDSNLDDILIVDSTGNQLQLVSQLSFVSGPSTEGIGKRTTAKGRIAVTALETVSTPLAILPLQLNMDALSDLVLLRQGSSVPSVVMSAPSGTLVVTSIDDTGDCLAGNPCSLRNAILYANSHGGVETINFDLGGAATITPSAELPEITEAVNIFGTVAGNGQPDIEITGTNVPAPANGLSIRTSDTFIFGLTINGFKSTTNGQNQTAGNGIAIYSNSASQNNGNNTILSTFLGTDRTGSLDNGNDATGLNIFDSDNNQIIQNVISGNGSQEKFGVGIAVTDGNSNLFQNNIVGLNALGNGKLGNSEGVFLTGANNVFGGDGAGEGNTVSGNGEISVVTPEQCIGNGIFIPLLVNLDTQELATLGNRISGNRVGTNPAGSAGLGNCWRGIQTTPLTTTSIGSITENGRNTVSDNGYDAIWCGDPTVGDSTDFGFCSIAGNNVGTDISGTGALFNDKRNIPSGLGAQSAVVFIGNNLSVSQVGAPGGTTPGGACTGFCNLISGNDGSPNINSGFGLEAAGPGLVGVFNNYIGTTKSGNQALPNLLAVDLAGSTMPNAAPAFFLGGYGLQDGLPVSMGNLISGNTNGTVAGVGLNGDYFVLGNKIGTDASGTFAIPNVGGEALSIQTGFGWGTVQIGDSDPLGGNIISGNGSNGIGIYFGVNTKIHNNLIGVNSSLSPLPNAGNGINIGGIFGAGAVVGGGESGNANVIANNDKSGIKVNNANAYYNNLRGNSIYDNGALGIDLGSNGYFGDGDGVTANDCLDFDFGANTLQNYPELNAPIFNGNGTITVEGTLRSSPAEVFTIDFYASPSGDPSDYGEGANFLGTKSVKTDGNGFVSFTFTSTIQAAPASSITATATGAVWVSTSEFSCIGGHCVPSAPSCSEPIVVNVTTDNSDANLSDAVCDSDLDTAGSQCSLRAAIEEANARAGKQSINFAISGGGVQAILPATALPVISEQVLINGASQPGYNESPLIEINGVQSTAADGLVVNASPSEIRALTINHFPQAAIRVQAATPVAGGSTISACYLGINPDGSTADAPQLKYGVSVVGSSGNFIGDKNVIGNFTDAGVFISGFGARDNRVVANRIGVRAVGSDPFSGGAGTYGILITSSAQKNSVGGDLTQGNLVSGSLLVGIGLDGEATENTIAGNLIGTSEDGNAYPSSPGDTGILIKGGAFKNIIGGITNLRNVVAGNTRSATSCGIHLDATAGSANRIVGNYIGTNLAGNARAGNSIGVVVDRSDVTIGGESGKPNVISGNTNFGIMVESETSPLSKVVISNNFIGTNSTGLLDALIGNTVGVLISGQVQDAKIRNNTISGNLTGVDISLGATATVSENFIGTGAAGQTALPNGIGIAVVQTTDCTVKDNIVSGNYIGIQLGDGIGQDPNQQPFPTKLFQKFAAQHPRPNGATVFTERITIQNNKIGTNLNGATAIGNLFAGIAVGENARNNKIGGSISGNKGNVIAGSNFNNAGYGIFVGTRTDDAAQGALPSDNLVQGNRIGLKAVQDEALPNWIGIYLTQADHNFIGGGMPAVTDTPNTTNTIGGNANDGVRLFGPRTQNNIIVNNFIGVTPTAIDAANGDNGVRILDAPNNRVGVVLNNDNEVGSSNVIGSNFNNGILIEGAMATGNSIFGNMIGLFPDPNGTLTRGNGDQGIKLVDAGNTAIGGTSPERRNFIGSNGSAGILIRGSGSTFNTVKNNVIGTDENNTPNLGNTDNGVWIADQAAHNMIGGLEANAGNIITGNGGSGVRIDDGAGCCNSVDPNSICNNVELGIDLGPEGITANDGSDSDSGANNLQNFPEFINAILVGGNLVIQYKVDSAPATSNYGDDGLYLEFFRGDASLEGETFLASTHYTEANYTAGMPGVATLVIPNAAALGIQLGDKLVATATDFDGNTSEFTSTNVGTVTGSPTAAAAIIEGQIVTSGGTPLGGIVITLSGTQNRRTITDDNGRYRFTEVETAGFYTVAPSRVNFSFSPGERSFSALVNRTEAAFTAVANPSQTANPLDTPGYFVRQHYLDFLGRDPDESGFNFWSDQIFECGSEAACIERRRINVSAAYFLSVEFQETGALVNRLYRASYDRRPLYAEFIPDTRAVAQDVVVGRQGWQAKLEANKQAFVSAFVQRPAFVAAYGNLDNSRFVDTLISQTGVSFTGVERDALVSGLDDGTQTRATVLRSIAENNRFATAKFNEAFVMMEYFGYLRRDPDESGYQFWLNKLNEFNGNFERAEMVKAFIVSGEYRNRFPR